MMDFSFIRLEPNFDKAKSVRPSQITDIFRADFIQLSPKETYLQITNTLAGISFSDNLAVYVVDCTDTQLADVTARVKIHEFTDNNGKQQIAFELKNLGVEFYKRPVFLKFVHTVSDAKWWSNAICISEYLLNRTTRFDYKSYREHAGIAYNIVNYYQSIRLGCYFEGNDGVSDVKEYTNTDGIKTAARLIDTEYEKYCFEAIDDFTYRRLNKMLSSDVIYVNGVRMTNKVVSPSTDRKGTSNFSDLDFKICIDYSESFNQVNQIFSIFGITSYSPFGEYTAQI